MIKKANEVEKVKNLENQKKYSLLKNCFFKSEDKYIKNKIRNKYI